MSTSPRAARGHFPADLSQLIVTGWQTNKFDGSIPFWADVDNLQFTENGIRRRPGKSLIFKPLNTSPSTYKDIRGITSLIEFGTRVLYVGDLNKIYRYKASDPVADGEVVGSGYALINNPGETIWVDTDPTTVTSVWTDEDEQGNISISEWDVDINTPTLWTFTNFGTWVIAANNVSYMQIKKNHETFTDVRDNYLTGALIDNSGTGHAKDDVITFSGGLSITVTDAPGGNVSLFKITNYGSGYTDGQVIAQSGTTGTGTNLQLQLTVTDCPFTRVKAVDKSGPHILAINYDKSNSEHPYDVAWCSADDPDTWVASASNSAGSLTLREASSPLRCIVPLGENKAIYTDDQMFILSYLGSPFYFGYQTAMTSGVGAVSAKAVVSVDRLNYGLSRRGLFETDGNSVKRIGDAEGINRYITQNIAEGVLEKVIAYHNKESNEVIWSLPIASTNINTEIAYNYSTGVFTKRTAANTAALESGVFSHVITADASSSIFLEDGTASPHKTFALSKPHDLEDPYAIKEITSVRVGKVGSGSPKVSIGWANNIDDEPTFSVSDSFFVTDKYKEHNVRSAGRYLFLKIESSNDADSWEISDVVIKGRIRGFR